MHLLTGFHCVVQQIGKQHHQHICRKCHTGQVIYLDVHIDPQIFGVLVLLIQDRVNHRMVGIYCKNPDRLHGLQLLNIVSRR